MTSHRIRASGALIAALFAAAVCQLGLIHMATLNVLGGSVLAQFWQTLIQTFAYGLPLGIAAVLATEVLRLRRLNIQIAFGLAATLLAGHLATRSEPMTSYVFTGGALAALGLVATAVVSAAIYWGIAGRRAGWAGDVLESEHDRATQAFQRASENSKSVRCIPCLLVWGGASAAAFGVFAWLIIGVGGLRETLISRAQSEGQSALKASGYRWAAFSIADSRGAIQGNAPDELEKRTAYDTAREALHSVTGFPGVLTRIEDQAVAQVPMAAVNQKLAEAQLREQQARQAIDDARRQAEAARAAEADAKRSAVEQSAAAESERQQRPEQQVAEQLPDQVEVQRRAAESLARTFDAAADSAPQEDTVAALNGEAPSADKVGASPPALATPHPCTDQDVAMVESSNILFDLQSFDISARFQRDLDRIAASVQSCAPRPVQVTGHSDATADRLFNPALGRQRAEAVRDGLIARGVGATSVAIKSAPVGLIAVSNGPDDNREMFRRIEFKFLEAIELSRDANQRPDERASNCESDLSEIMSQSIIHFPIASARISDESLGLIAKLAGAIQNCGSVIVTVEGHTDKIGTPERNQQLSIARANTVREALVTAGTDPTRLASRGFASTRPYAAEETAEAFALNRRIEFKVSGKFTSTNAGGP